MEKYKKEIEHFGMLSDYNDSQEYMRENPHLACEDTANYLALWCINLEVQEVCTLKELGLALTTKRFGSLPLNIEATRVK